MRKSFSLLLLCFCIVAFAQIETPKELKSVEKALKKESGAKDVVYTGDFFVLRDYKGPYAAYRVGTRNGKLLPGKLSGTGKYDLTVDIFGKKYLLLDFDSPLYDLDGNVVLDKRPWALSAVVIDGEKRVLGFTFNNDRTLKTNLVYDQDFNLLATIPGNVSLIELNGKNFFVAEKKLYSTAGDLLLDYSDNNDLGFSVKDGYVYLTVNHDGAYSQDRTVTKWEYNPDNSSLRAVINPDQPHISYCGKTYYYQKYGKGLYDIEGKCLFDTWDIDVHESDSPNYIGSYMIVGGSAFYDQNMKKMYSGGKLSAYNIDGFPFFLSTKSARDNKKDVWYYDYTIVDINGKEYPIEPKLLGTEYFTYDDTWHNHDKSTVKPHSTVESVLLKFENGQLMVKGKRDNYFPVPDATMVNMQYRPLAHGDVPVYTGILLKSNIRQVK